MKQSVLQRPLPNQSLPRNAFDRGFETKFNFSAGQLLPVFAQPVLGKSKCRINRQLVLRAAQVQTAAFARMSVNVDFYFVPFRLLYSFYGSKRTNVSDLNSVLLQNHFSEDKNADLPLFDPLSYWDEFAQSQFTDGSSHEKDMFGFDIVQGHFRLLDMLDYGVNYRFIPKIPLISTDNLYSRRFHALPTQNPFRFLAYQKIWFDHYRNSNYYANDPSCYNVDNEKGNDFIATFYLKKMLQLRYVPYRKDYFTNIYPSLNYASSGLQPFSPVVPSQVFGATFDESDYTSSFQSNTGEIAIPAFEMQGKHSLPITGFNAQSIRALFALDKLTRLSAYAPKHVADQFEARFGFRPYAEDINESVRIGSFASELSISEVLNQAETERAALGALGGRGFAVDNFQRDIEYTAPEDGLIMGVAYVLPRMSYDAGGVDAFNNFLSLNDFPQPEFMDLGLSPIRRKELYFASNFPEATQPERIVEVNNEILGYQPMYSSWKIGVDRNHGLFINNSPLGTFVTHTKERFTDLGSLSESQEFLEGVNGSYFYCSPRDLDRIFAEVVTDDQLTDQFFGLIRFKFDVVQPLSVHGQPSI